jgi:hypothetical protein
MDYCGFLIKDFLKRSMPTLKVLLERLNQVKQESFYRKITLFRFHDNERINVPFEGVHFFLRGSVEYTAPQLTLEEVQGIVAVRLLEACGNYLKKTGLHEPTNQDIDLLCEALKKPPEGLIVPSCLTLTM